jgi:hypothetical protein
MVGRFLLDMGSIDDVLTVQVCLPRFAAVAC